jgi:replication initiation protein RepC
METTMELCLSETATQATGSQRGIRRTTPSLLEADRVAAGFSGLPSGVSRWTVMRVTRLAAPLLGVTARELQLLEIYIEHTFDADWSAGAEPIVITPVIELAEALGVSERQVRNIEHKLLARGLITFRDSGNHARRGRRDRKTGRLVYGYGPSLAALAARFAEIDALAEQVRIDRLKARQTRQAIAALRRRITADIDLLETKGLHGAADAAMEKFREAPMRFPAGASTKVLDEARRQLSSLAQTVADLLDTPQPDRQSQCISAQAEGNVRPNKQRPLQDFPRESRSERSESFVSPSLTQPSARDTVTLLPATNAWKGLEHSAKTAAKPKQVTHGVERIALSAVRSVLPQRFTAYVDPERPLTWTTLVDAASDVCRELGVPQYVWGQACGVLGRNAAAIALVLIDERTRSDRTAPERTVSNPAAYLRGLVNRGIEGNLRLDASIFALQRRDCAVH